MLDRERPALEHGRRRRAAPDLALGAYDLDPVAVAETGRDEREGGAADGVDLGDRSGEPAKRRQRGGEVGALPVEAERRAERGERQLVGTECTPERVLREPRDQV